MPATSIGAVEDIKYHTFAVVLVFLPPQASIYTNDLDVARMGQQNALTEETSTRQALLDGNAQLSRLRGERDALRDQIIYIYMCVYDRISGICYHVDCDEV